MPDEPDVFDEPEEVAVCEVCDQNQDDCECVNCHGCSDRVETTCSNCNRCDECCDCSTCRHRRCGERFEHTCSNCGFCDSHCECSYCRGCDSYYTEGGCRIGNCDYCSECCDCSNSDDAPRLSGRFQYLGEMSKAVPRYISLELEYDGCDNTSAVEYACRAYGDAIVEDGSLSDGGFEINTNPHRGDGYFQHIREVVTATSRANSTVNRKTGLHVHVDARDLNWHDMYKLALLYRKVEDAIFQMQPQSRQDNRYCMRVEGHYAKPAKGYKHTLLKTLYEQHFPASRMDKNKPMLTTKTNFDTGKAKKVFYQRTEKYNSARYYAMNIHTFFYRGTIEFRHAASTTNVTKATNWGLVCMWIVEQASKMTVAQINSLPSNPTLALTEILPQNLREFVIERQADQRAA